MQLSTPSGATAEINRLHEEICQATATSLDKAITIGGLLTRVKAGLKHGEWLNWVENNLQFGERTCRNYTHCFEKRELLKSANVSDLTKAYAVLAEGRQATADSQRLEDLEGAIRNGVGQIDVLLQEGGEAIPFDAHLDAPLDQATYLADPPSRTESQSGDIFALTFDVIVASRFKDRGTITLRELGMLKHLEESARAGLLNQSRSRQEEGV
jgi:hypothetical protein